MMAATKPNWNGEPKSEFCGPANLKRPERPKQRDRTGTRLPTQKKPKHTFALRRVGLWRRGEFRQKSARTRLPQRLATNSQVPLR